MDPMDVSASALGAERLRMDVIASNIANVNTTRNSQGQIMPYKHKSVVFKTILDEQGSKEGVTVNGIVEDGKNMRIVYDPRHPDANDDGYVYFPNVSIEKEMVDLSASKAAYQANVSAIQTYKRIYNSALEL